MAVFVMWFVAIERKHLSCLVSWYCSVLPNNIAFYRCSWLVIFVLKQYLRHIMWRKIVGKSECNFIRLADMQSAFCKWMKCTITKWKKGKWRFRRIGEGGNNELVVTVKHYSTIAEGLGKWFGLTHARWCCENSGLAWRARSGRREGMRVEDKRLKECLTGCAHARSWRC